MRKSDRSSPWWQLWSCGQSGQKRKRRVRGSRRRRAACSPFVALLPRRRGFAVIFNADGWKQQLLSRQIKVRVQRLLTRELCKFIRTRFLRAFTRVWSKTGGWKIEPGGRISIWRSRRGEPARSVRTDHRDIYRPPDRSLYGT